MLILKVPMGEEYYDETKKEFFFPEEFTLELEHSLASLSKWESREEKAFLSKDDKTAEQTLAYVRDMVLTPDVPEEVFQNLPKANLDLVNEYIAKKMTATWFHEMGGQRRNSPEVITAELIYFWMVSHNIPFECQYWHLNRLITLIRVCNEKNKPQKKMPRQTVAERQRQLNQSRRAKHGTRG